MHICTSIHCSFTWTLYIWSIVEYPSVSECIWLVHYDSFIICLMLISFLSKYTRVLFTVTVYDLTLSFFYLWPRLFYYDFNWIIYFVWYRYPSVHVYMFSTPVWLCSDHIYGSLMLLILLFMYKSGCVSLLPPLDLCRHDLRLSVLLFMHVDRYASLWIDMDLHIRRCCRYIFVSMQFYMVPMWLHFKICTSVWKMLHASVYIYVWPRFTKNPN